MKSFLEEKEGCASDTFVVARFLFFLILVAGVIQVRRQMVVVVMTVYLILSI